MDQVSKYYARICKTRILTTEEEKDLLLILRNEDNPIKVRESARERLAESHLRFVFKTARTFAKKDPSNFDDLIAAGNEGLMVGIDKYDVNSGVKLLTYAGYWVRQRLFDCQAGYRTVRVPVWRQQLSARIRKLRDANPSITVEECIEQITDAKPKDIKELFETQFLSFSLEEMHESGVEDFLVDPFEGGVEDTLYGHQLLSIIGKLEYPCSAVILESFGLLDGEDKKSSEVGELLGLSVEQVKKLKKQGLEQLKTLLHRTDFD